MKRMTQLAQGCMLHVPSVHVLTLLSFLEEERYVDDIYICDCVIFSKSRSRVVGKSQNKHTGIAIIRWTLFKQRRLMFWWRRDAVEFGLWFILSHSHQCDSKQTSDWTAKVEFAFDLDLLIEFLFLHDTHPRGMANRQWSDTINICFNFISRDYRNCTESWHSWHPHNCFLSIDLAIRLSLKSLMSIPAALINSHWREANRRRSNEK